MKRNDNEHMSKNTTEKGIQNNASSDPEVLSHMVTSDQTQAVSVTGGYSPKMVAVSYQALHSSRPSLPWSIPPPVTLQ